MPLLNDANALEMMNQTAAGLPAEPPVPVNGRGIVICAGGTRYFLNAWVCIRMLRALGCQLPVQVWHLGPKEIDDTMRGLLTPLGVTCIDAFQVRQEHAARILNGWEVKPFSIIHSGFRHVLSLDADNVPVVDPTYLFDTPEYHERGAIFWPDFSRLRPERSIWRLTGVQHRDEPEFESGQIVVDTLRCCRPLALAMWMNEHSDYWYRHIHGDKETFHMSWRKLEQTYAMPRRGIQALSGTMCQHDFHDTRIFQHRNMAKWSMRGNRKVNGFLYEQECLAYIDELKPYWRQLTSVAIYSPRGKSEAMTAVAERLASTPWTYHRVGYDRRTITFNLDGTIGDGAARMEIFWDISESNGETFIDIQSDNALTCRLRLCGDGVWRGKWERHERMPIEIAPATTSATPARLSSPAGTAAPAALDTPPERPTPAVTDCRSRAILGVTIAVGEDPMRLAIKSAASVRKYARIPTTILAADPNESGSLHPRLGLFDFVDGTIFYFEPGAELLCPWDLSDLVNNPSIVAQRAAHSSCLLTECEKYGLNMNRYFSINVFVANRRYHGRIFEEARRWRGLAAHYADQTMLNIAAARHNVPIRYFDSSREHFRLNHRDPREPGGISGVHQSKGPHECIPAADSPGILQTQPQEPRPASAGAH